MGHVVYMGSITSSMPMWSCKKFGTLSFLTHFNICSSRRRCSVGSKFSLRKRSPAIFISRQVRMTFPPENRYKWKILSTWWRHNVETLSALLVLCAGNHRWIPARKDQWCEALVFSLLSALSACRKKTIVFSVIDDVLQMITIDINHIQ